MVHLSRLAEDWIIWSSEPFRFIDIDQAYATGSSMMPQKKNPDSLELVRGKSARVIGHLTTLLTLMKGIPTAYVRDLQEDKEPLFDAVLQTIMSLLIVNGVVDTCKVDVGRMRQALEPALYATDIADYLVLKGMPFRQAHHIIGKIVAEAETKNIVLSEFPMERLKAYSQLFDADIYKLFNPIVSLQKRNLYGGTGPVSVKKQIKIAKKYLKQFFG
jgi:argininosuccinate lyase